MRRLPLFESTEDDIISKLKEKFTVEHDPSASYPWNIKMELPNEEREMQIHIGEGGTITAVVQGLKSDIPLGDIGTTAEDVASVLDSLDEQWFKENDPDDPEYNTDPEGEDDDIDSDDDDVDTGDSRSMLENATQDWYLSKIKKFYDNNTDDKEDFVNFLAALKALEKIVEGEISRQP